MNVLIKGTKIEIFVLLTWNNIELFFGCKVKTIVNTKPLIKRLLSTVVVCCRLLSDILLIFNIIKKAVERGQQLKKRFENVLSIILSCRDTL